MSLEKKYNSIDQSKLKPAVRDILKKMKDKSENFTNSDINKKVEPALDKLLMRLQKELPEAIKKATKTPSKPKAKPKAKAKAKPKTKSTKETFTQKASKLMKQEGISWAEAKNKLSKQLKDEKDKVEKDIKSDNKQALNELDKLIKSTEFKKDLGKFPKKSSGEERELTSDISADGKRQALPRGKRKSKNGKTYYEYRDNRSDVNSLPAPKGQYRYKGKTPPYLEAGGTLPTPFGQAGLVGETGTMNEVDLFAMGGGLPQGVHQYYAQTYNPAYPTPHGYAKGGTVDLRNKETLKRLKIDLKESQKYLDSIPKNIDKDDQISKTFGGNKYTGAVNTKEQLKENIEQLKSDIKNLTYANGGDIPVGFHKMPNGEIMADSEHLAEGGETIDGFTLNTIKGVANKPTNVDIDKLDINYAEGGVILTYNKPNKAINLTNVKSKEDFDNLIKHYKENASSIHYINESDIKRNKHWLVVVKYKDNDDFIVNNFSNKKEAKELFNHYQDMETVDFVNLFDLDGTTYAEGGEIDLFEDYEKQPKELAEIVETYQERYADGDMDYESTKEFLGKVNAIGYTFDSGLDNEPFGLRKMAKGGKTKRSKHSIMQDRRRVSSEPWEVAYQKRKAKMEAGGTLPTPFGQAGLVGETGTMNEVDLFAMGGGLPQGVHQYYAQTYNPAYPTPHGYAKGGTVDLRNKETLKRLKIDLKESQKYLDSIPKNIDKDDQISKTFGGNKYTGAVNTKEQLKENIEQLKSDIKNLTYANGGDIPVGFHKMPNGEIMADSEHLAEGGETIDGFTLNTIKGVANKPTNVDIDKLDINYAEGGVILTYNKPNKAINLTNVKSKEDFDNLIKHYKENASSIHYINESDIKRNKHWLVVVKYKDNDDFIVNNFSNKKEAKELFNHYQDMETVDFVNLFDLDGTTYAEGGEIDLFEDYEKQPKELAEIVETYQERYADGDMDYESTKEFLGKVNAIGYTFDSGLDNEPFGLRKMAKGGKTKRSKHSIMQDRRRVSSEPWEVAYQKRKAKMESGGKIGYRE